MGLTRRPARADSSHGRAGKPASLPAGNRTRDENGNIMKESKFNLMAATRYLLLGSMQRWIKNHAPRPLRRVAPGGLIWT